MKNLKESIKQMSKKKKIICLSIIIIVILAIIIGTVIIVSNSGNTEIEEPKTIEELIEQKVKARALVEAKLTYEGTPSANVTAIDISNDGTTATAYGKVTVRDNYGDIYTGKFTAEVTINNGDTIIIKDIEIETPTRNRFKD